MILKGYLKYWRIKLKSLNSIKQNIKRIIKGKDEIIDLVLICLISNGHILIDDVPGTGKTFLLKTLAKSIELEFSRIQFTSYLPQSDITGINFFN